MSDHPVKDIDATIRQFEYFGREVFQGKMAVGASPLYAQLALNAATDPEILALLDEVEQEKLLPNLLFSSVNDLLMGGERDPLADFFANLTDTPRAPEDAYPIFRAFCLRHADTLRQRAKTRRVQTNEVRRCAALVPAFGLIAGREAGTPLALVEVGASAGLNLLWDHYSFDYGAAGKVGNVMSPVQLTCEVRGSLMLPIPDTLPEVAYRIGVDLYPIDVRDEDAARWLKALIWPEHAERIHTIERALEIARHNPPALVAGDLLEALPGVLANVPTDATLVIYHSWILNQVMPEVRERFAAMLLEHAQSRDFYRVSVEMLATPAPQLDLFSYQGGIVRQETLANCEAHGGWIEWLDANTAQKG
jgi:hypothetical protein